MPKNAWIYHDFTHVHQKLWPHDVRFLRYAVQQTDGQMDTKSDISKWHAPTKNPEIHKYLEKYHNWAFFDGILQSSVNIKCLK